jgi:Family of unknown function (DUF6516)
VAQKSGRKSVKKSRKVEKRIDNTSYLTGKRRGAVLKEEGWYLGSEVVKYINPRTCAVDKGRVLGYDNSHDYDHRHFMGEVEEVEFPGYEALVDRFQKEVEDLWRAEDEQER